MPRNGKEVNEQGLQARFAWDRDDGASLLETCDPVWHEGPEENGISRATLSRIEQGHIYPSRQIRKKLAKALGVGPQELWNLRSEDLTGRAEKSREQAS